jgi:hypothetical protein
MEQGLHSMLLTYRAKLATYLSERQMFQASFIKKKESHFVVEIFFSGRNGFGDVETQESEDAELLHCLYIVELLLFSHFLKQNCECEDRVL